MKLLKRNCQTIWYTRYLSKTEVIDEDGYRTGEVVEQYSKPVALKVVVTPGTGNATLEIFGVNDDYDKIIITDNVDCPINEYSQIWIDSNPRKAKNDYIVKRVSKSLNSISYGVTKVKKDEHKP